MEPLVGLTGVGVTGIGVRSIICSVPGPQVFPLDDVMPDAPDGEELPYGAPDLG
jgi:hypothetical protein